MSGPCSTWRPMGCQTTACPEDLAVLNCMPVRLPSRSPLRLYTPALTLSLSAALLPTFAQQAMAATPDAQAEALAQQADQRLHGFGDSRARLTMTLISPSGQTASRQLRVQTLENGKDGDRSLMVFDTPRDVSGTALLTQTRVEADDLQWLYLPALGRVKQIGGGNKSGPFMGSEFAFEDIVTPYWQKYRYSLIGDQKCSAPAVTLTCTVLERTPKDPNSGYTRQQVWIDRQDLLIRRIDFYDRKNTLLKTYTASGFQQVQGQWRPSSMLMVNLQTHKQTRLDWSDYQFRTGLKPADFSETALKRTR